jgi:uncharacterized protein
MSLYESAILQPKKMLTNLGNWIDAGVAHAQKKGFDADVLLGLRLAPDMYPLVRQVQSACDSTKLTAARLAGKEAPKHPDTEKTIEEVKQRLQTVIAYLDTFTAQDLEGAESRSIKLAALEGKAMLGADYLREWGLPNIYFHVTTAYAILRHGGVELGKRDFIGRVTTHDAP